MLYYIKSKLYNKFPVHHTKVWHVVLQTELTLQQVLRKPDNYHSFIHSWFLATVNMFNPSPSYFICHYLSIYIYILCFSVCLFVSNKRQNGWTDRVHFFLPQGRFMDDRIFKKFASNKIRILKILKIHEFFCYCFTVYTMRKCSQSPEKSNNI